MPIFKYKTFEEAERALWNFQPDETYFTKVAELWNFANKLSPIIYPKGIFKFKTLKEVNKHREEFELKNAKNVQILERETHNFSCGKLSNRNKR